MSLLVSDLGLIRRIHRAALQFIHLYGEAKTRLSPTIPFEFLTMGSSVASYFGADDPINEVMGLGLDGPVTAEQLDRIERFYLPFGASPTFTVAPCAEPSLLAQLGERGYRLREMEQVWVHPLDGALPAPSSVTVEACTPADREGWVATWLEGFGLPAPFGLIAEAIFTMPSAMPFWVRVGGRPVAVANMTVADGLAWFFGTATVPGYRGRGFQGALLQERLRVAKAAGCEVALVETAVANGSARNCERAGFRVLYTKVKLAK